jgi:hypothetical protein
MSFLLGGIFNLKKTVIIAYRNILNWVSCFGMNHASLEETGLRINPACIRRYAMKKIFRSRLVIFAIFLIAILGITVVFTESALAEKTGVVRLSVINRSQFEFSLDLYGPGSYSLSVPAKSDGKVFVDRNEYSYVMEVCNYVKTGTINMNIWQKIHVPPCGGKGVARPKLHHIDTSKIVKPIRITVKNKTGEKVDVYLRTIDDHHFLKFETGEVKTVIVKKEDGVAQDYVYSFQGCGDGLITGYYTPRVTPPLILECP